MLVFIATSRLRSGHGPTTARQPRRSAPVFDTRAEGGHRSQAATICAAAAAAPTCTWIRNEGCREPGCLISHCGLLSCTCKRAPLNDLMPWDILGLDLSSALSPATIASAFEDKVWLLHPTRNAGCVNRASAEFVAARRARDTLMSIASLSTATDLAIGTRHSKTRYSPSSPSTRRTTRRISKLKRGKRARVGKVRSALGAPGDIGKPHSLFRAIFEWVKRSKATFNAKHRGHNWWARVRGFVEDLIRAPMDAFRFLFKHAYFMFVVFSLALFQGGKLV